MSTPNPWILIATRGDPAEADLVKALLKSQKIPVVVRHDGMRPIAFRGRVEGFEIYVPPDYERQAQQALEDYSAEEKERYDFWGSGKDAG
jgi:hypothetical protein